MIAPHPARPAPVPRGLDRAPRALLPNPAAAARRPARYADRHWPLRARRAALPDRAGPRAASRAHVQGYDPSLKTGAVKRALDRLLNRGWLIAAPTECQRKQRYTPSWGRIKGAPLPWQMGQSCLGRPRQHHPAAARPQPA